MHDPRHPTTPTSRSRRRRLLATGTALTAALTLAACSGDSDAASTNSSTADESSTAPDTTEPTSEAAAETTTATEPAAAPATVAPTMAPATSAAESEAAFPVTITHRLGDVTIDEQPERIVALGVNDIEIVYALGLTPVAVTPDFGTGELAASLQDDYSIEGVEIIQTRPEVPLEAIAALEPDIILASPFPTIDNDYENLSNIAPVIADTDGVLTDTWQQRAEKVGEALGMQSEVDAIIADAEQALADFAANHPGLDGKTFSFSLVRSPDQIGATNDPNDVTTQFFGEFGMTLPDSLTDTEAAEIGTGASSALNVSLEELDLLDADAVFIAFPSDEVREAVESNPLFQALPAVANGNYQAIDFPTAVALRSPGPVSVGWILEQISPLLTKVAER